MTAKKKHTGSIRKGRLLNSTTAPSAIQPSAITLNHLLQRRYHGASNIRGVEYQVLYFCLRAFDLLQNDAPDSLLGEGLEDIDLRSVQLGNEYVQVKHLGRPMDQSVFGGIVSSFRDVLVADPSAQLRIVTDAKWAQELNVLCNATNIGHVLTASSHANLVRLLGPDFPITPEEFLRRLKFERITEPQIRERLAAAVIKHFDVAIGNEALYVQALFQELISRSGNRIEVNRVDVEAVYTAVEELISVGTLNPAVRDGYIQRLAFASEAHTEDYYEGRAARPGHIAAHLDVPRPKIMSRIEEVFERHPVCVVVTSSGQGKSTLGYRYCHDHHLPQTTYILKACQTEADVGQISKFLRSQLRAKLPLLILVDNLGVRTELWHRVASELAGEQVRFLVTARQEDWFRYAGATASFSWAVVTPYLSREEAGQIFVELSKRGLVVPEVTSAGAAYEKVQERQLLIEYIYLLTHGHLLHERLEEQITALRQSDQDPGTVEAVRLVSTAHHYGAKVRAEHLAAHAGFQQDPQQGLRALEDEYILCSQGFCEGLHPVRSEHLMNLLHDPLPVENTLEKLIVWLDPADLETLVSSTLADPAIQAGRLLKALVERCLNAAPELTATVAHACYYAEEQRYYLKHQSVFDQAYRDAGAAGVHMLAIYTMPYGSIEPLKTLAETMPEARAAADALAHLSEQFQPRVPQQRLEYQLLAEVLPRMDAARFAADLPALAELLHWCFYAHIPLQMFEGILRHSRWQENIFALPLEEACSFAYALSRIAPEEHGAWYRKERQRIISYFKWRSHTLSVLEEGDTVRVEYAVEWSSEASSPNEQSVSRLYALSRLLPDYQTYCSYGIHLLGEEVVTGYDETIKNLTRESIRQKVDSSKNGDWIRLCQQKHAIDSLTIWLAKWEEIRQHSLTLVQQLCGTYDRLYREQPISQKRKEDVSNLLNELQQGFQRTPLLPETLAPLERKRLEKLITNWTAHFSNFVRQYTEYNPQKSEDHYSRLMRINLKNAIKALPDFNEALGSVAVTFGRGTPSADSLGQETAAYERLADFLDYWFEGKQKYLPNPNRATTEWRRDQQAKFLTEVYRSLQPLEEAGFKFVLPTQWLVDYPLTSICLGVEVQDFFRVDDDIVAIAQALNNAACKFDYLQIVLTIGNRQYQRQIHRMNRDSIQTLAQGEQPGGMWLFPVDPPEGIQDVLPDLLYDPFPELDRVHEFYAGLGKMTSQTRLRALANQSLHPTKQFEEQLLEELEAETLRGVNEATQDLERCLYLMGIMSVPAASEMGWQKLVHRCHQLTAEALTSSSATLDPLKIDEQLQAHLLTYLDLAYLRPR